MTNFEVLLPLILANEGVSESNPTGLADIPNDPGGVTNWGISSKAWSRILGQAGSEFTYSGYPSDVKSLTKAHIEVIYRNNFYPPICEELPLGLAYVIFDAEVNSGNGNRILQSALGVDSDGNIGPKSREALRLALRDGPKLIEAALWERLRFYTKISKDSSTDQGFLVHLWIPRLLSVRKDALRI